MITQKNNLFYTNLQASIYPNLSFGNLFLVEHGFFFADGDKRARDLTNDPMGIGKKWEKNSSGADNESMIMPYRILIYIGRAVLFIDSENRKHVIRHIDFYQNGKVVILFLL